MSQVDHTAGYTLSTLGWSHHFQQQLSLTECETTTPVRVSEVHRSQLTVLGEQGELTVELSVAWLASEESERPTVGDWLLLERDGGAPWRLLERKSLFRRMRPGGESGEQLLAANVDTVFVVSSCNEEFNPSRIERYLALAHEAQVTPVVVLTKIDLCEDAERYVAAARALAPGLRVEAIDARARASAHALDDLLSPGQTISLLGSSGTGKSTLLNTLSGETRQATAQIREGDKKGRHTTTSRSLHVLPQGALLIDTPGMRELQLPGAEQGVAEAFGDVETLALRCRFHDCRHEGEPRCAVAAAVAAGELEPRRLDNYRKLLAEQARNAVTLADKRRRERAQGRLYREVQASSRARKKDA